MKVKKKILILGSSGNLGFELYNKLKKDFIVSHNGLIKKKLDITNVKNLEKIIKKNNPNIIINAAGYVNLDLCEKNKKKCLKINADIIKNIFLVRKKIDQHFKILHFSTDQLYDGKPFYKTEKHKIKINNFYSKTKHLSEKIALRHNSTVFRINFFGFKKNKSGSLDMFIKNSIRNGNCILFDDVYFNPLRIKTIVNIIHKIIKKNKLSSGLFNLGSKDGLSKKDFYILIFKYLKKNINYKSFKVNSYLNTKRSRNMLMSVKKFEEKYNIRLPLIKNEIKKEIIENYESIKNRKK